MLKWDTETNSTPTTNCKKIRSHKKYIDPGNLSIKDVPRDLKVVGTLLLECIKNMSSLTCKIKNGSTIGTGFVQRVRRSRGSKCPIENCDDHGEVVLITVTTVTSVVSTTSASVGVSLCLQEFPCDLKMCSVRCPEKDGSNSDWCEVVFGSHDVSLFDRFHEAIRKFEETQKKLYADCENKIKRNSVIVIGVPHGDKVKVSFGHLRRREKVTNSRGDQVWCEYSYDAPTCAGSSGSPLLIPGQPLAGYGYWFGHPHCHNVYNDYLKLGRSSIGSEMRTEPIKYEDKTSHWKGILSLAIVGLLAITTYVYYY